MATVYKKMAASNLNSDQKEYFSTPKIGYEPNASVEKLCFRHYNEKK